MLPGTSGGMASSIRPLPGRLAETVVLSSRKRVDDLAPHEEWQLADPNVSRNIYQGGDFIDQTIVAERNDG